MEENPRTPQAATEIQARIEMNVSAFRSGEKAKRCGWFRISPFSDEVSDEFFLAGYDGIPWPKAIRGEFH